MKLLHTSDWHIGKNLYGRKRYKEIESFLNWIVDTIENNGIDTLVVAGDIFDTTTPSNKAVSIYYNFLSKMNISSCKNIIIVSGNHDSPSFIDTSKELLKSLNIKTIGGIDTFDDQIIPLYSNDKMSAVICAVPYLRERDIRKSKVGETLKDKAKNLSDGIANHYRVVVDKAIEVRGDLDIPIIATGHLPIGNISSDRDRGERDIYIGSLEMFNKKMFPKEIDYMALGHIHRPGLIGGDETFRYSGSPLPMSFGEIGQRKEVLIVSYNSKIEVESLEVPSFQRLERINDTFENVITTLTSFNSFKESILCEIEITDDSPISRVSERVKDAVKDSPNIEILRVKSKRFDFGSAKREKSGESLDTLNETEVFQRCLDVNCKNEAEQDELRASYQEILTTLSEKDPFAE